MKERPIIFSADSVRAILAGNKTQTRRLIKIQPPSDATFAGQYRRSDQPYEAKFDWCKGDPADVDTWEMLDTPEFRCPYGVPGDRLWVRETFNVGWLDNNGVLYKANGGSAKDAGYPKEPKWSSPLHMPRWASRITLEITDVRVQLVQEISEEDAKAEGLRQQIGDGLGPGPGWKFDGIGHYGSHPDRVHAPRNGRCSCVIGMQSTPICAYRDLWDSINAKKHPWSSNPWVWCVSFRRVDGKV